MNTREVIRVFRESTDFQSVQQLWSVISALWSNETAFCSLSKFIQQA